jgi:ubiquinol-cytochrome c reductase iron-sulfur subunit
VHGETVYLRRDTGNPEEISLVRAEDQAAGSMETVFPFREEERGDAEALQAALRAPDTPTMLIRFRPGTQVIQGPGTENYHYGDYYAYSKICTHLGCPASLYEAQTQRILCPCHQSQFLATDHARPIFGPATRALPQLPITVNDEGYLIATGDFNEPVGPAFWELRS